jgi:hypothetical protein
MGADIVNSEEAVQAAEKADLNFAERDATAFADGDLFQFESGVDVGHKV